MSSPQRLRMATRFLLVLAASCLLAHALPQEPAVARNTIFNDEKLEGGIFEHVDEFNDIALYSRADNPYRLPTTTRPDHYNLLMMVDISTLSFSGEMSIQLYATQENVNEIVIHAHDLNINSITLSQGTTNIPIQDFTFEPVYHFLRIRLLNTVLNYNPTQPIIYVLTITFNAPLRTDMTGLYRNWFRNNATDEVSWMASTHFQATAARFAFPCYDEPNLKATFDVVIRRPIGYGSWFCTKLLNTRPGAVTGYEEDVFTTTPRMPTYLIAIIVAEYKSYAKYVDGVLVYEVIARPSAIEAVQHEYAFNTGQDLLQEMSSHTNYDFYSLHPNLKMTQAAIPDFRAGAMENWGLLLYREAYLMYDENHTNGYFKQLIAYILSHEIAHMWFGNLVTCDWWDNFWLNEGFARYYQYFLTDWVENHLGLGIRFINEQMHTALLADSANNPHPLTNPGIGDPVAIRAMFSTISYNKGAAVIRMTEHLLGFNTNREGLRNYLVERRFDTAEPTHLFQSLQRAANEAGALTEYGADFNINDYYTSWTVQAGHPVLNVQVDHNTGLMTINQRRFNINTGYSTASTNWIVPITFATASNPDFINTKPTHIITNVVSVINRNSVGDEWVVLNKQQTGFYRVNYDDYTWNLIVNALRGPQRTVIHEYNRAQIVDDVLQFARSGIMSYNRAFNIISFIENETEYTPWLAAITGLNWIRNRLVGTPQQAGLQAVLVRWTNTAITSLGYTPQPNESFMRSYLRYQLAPFVCNLNVRACRDSALAQFRELRDNNVEVPVDSRNWVYCNALREGTVEDFNFLWQRFLSHNVYTEKILLLQVLGCTPHRQALYTFLDGIVQDNFIIRVQDYTTAFNSAVSGNEGNTQIVFQYIKENLQTVTNAFGLAETALSYISSRLRTEQEIVEFETWADDTRQALGSSYAAVRAGAQSSRNAIRWAATVQSDIQSYFDEGDQEFENTTPAVEVTTIGPTETPADLVEPTTPELPEPDSANTAFLSVVTVTLALIANLAIRYY